MAFPFEQLAVADVQRPRWWRRLHWGGAALLRRPARRTAKESAIRVQKKPIARATSFSKTSTLQFEPLEPRLLLSADPLSAAAGADTVEELPIEAANDELLSDAATSEQVVSGTEEPAHAPQERHQRPFAKTCVRF